MLRRLPTRAGVMVSRVSIASRSTSNTATPYNPLHLPYISLTSASASASTSNIHIYIHICI